MPIPPSFQMTKTTRMDNTTWPTWLHDAWNGTRNRNGTLQRITHSAELPDKLEIITDYGPEDVEWGDWIVLLDYRRLTVSKYTPSMSMIQSTKQSDPKEEIYSLLLASLNEIGIVTEYGVNDADQSLNLCHSLINTAIGLACLLKKSDQRL